MDTEKEKRSQESRKTFGFKDVVKFMKYAVLLAILVIIIMLIWQQISQSGKEKNQTIVDTSSKLEKILQISELSTYQVTFNGVTDVNDDDGSLLYHVAYHAKVGIGLDMEKIKVTINDSSEEYKKLIVTLPEITITEANVEPGSLEYIFENSSANTESVSMTALPACKADAEAECQSNEVIFELAEENAVNTIKALAQPLLAQSKEYRLEIQTAGGNSYE